MSEDEKSRKISRVLYSLAGFALILIAVGYFVIDNVVRNYYKNNPFSQIINDLDKFQAEQAKKSK